MLFFTFATITIALMIVALSVKTTSSGMLRIASSIAWAIMIPISFAQTWPATNTYLPAATSLFCALMMIIMIAATIMYYVDWSRGRRAYVPTDDETQVKYRKQVYGITRKKRDFWDER